MGGSSSQFWRRKMLNVYKEIEEIFRGLHFESAPTTPDVS